jgi:hypothetical protein
MGIKIPTRTRQLIARKNAEAVEARRVLRRERFAFAKRIKTEFNRGFIAGSAAGFGGAMASMDDLEMQMWLSNKSLTARKRTPPFKFDPRIEAVVEEQIQDLLRRCGVRPNSTEKVSCPEWEL